MEDFEKDCSTDFYNQILKNLERAVEKDRTNNKDPPDLSFKSDAESRRVWCIELYQTVNDLNALKRIESIIEQDIYSYHYVGILHDKDINDNGELKKPHYHLMIFFEKPVRRGTLRRRYNLTKIQVEEKHSSNTNDCLIYLVHGKERDKYHYDTRELFGDQEKINRICSLLAKEYKEYELSLITKYVLQGHTKIETWQYCLDNGFSNAYRRYYSIIRDLFHEIDEKMYYTGYLEKADKIEKNIVKWENNENES